MSKPKAVTVKKAKSLEITLAYAEYKMRHAGDLDGDLANWADNIQHFIEIQKVKK